MPKDRSISQVEKHAHKDRKKNDQDKKEKVKSSKQEKKKDKSTRQDKSKKKDISTREDISKKKEKSDSTGSESRKRQRSERSSQTSILSAAATSAPILVAAPLSAAELRQQKLLRLMGGSMPAPSSAILQDRLEEQYLAAANEKSLRKKHRGLGAKRMKE